MIQQLTFNNFELVTDRIKEVLNLHHDKEVALAIGMKQGAFYERKRNGKVPYEHIISELGKKGISLEYIFYGLGDQQITAKLKLDNEPSAPFGKIAVKMFPDISASAGYGCLNGDNCEYETIFVDRNLLSRTSSKNIEAIQVSGDSMVPTMSDGDMIFVDKSQHEIKNGKIFIIRMNDEIFVKRIFIGPRGLIVKSDNPNYPQFDIKKNEAEVIGQVIYTMEYHG